MLVPWKRSADPVKPRRAHAFDFVLTSSWSHRFSLKFRMKDQIASQLHALRQNIAPNAKERASILQSISDAEIALSSGEDDQTQYLRSCISLLSSRLAPIRRLPFDVLSAIFMDPSLHNPIPDAGSFRRLAGRGSDPLTAVSFHWRATALSMPQLWSTFAVVLAGDDDVERLLQLYLDRSKNCPLSLAIRAKTYDQVHSGLLRYLLGSCARWYKLHIRMSNSDLMTCLAAVRGRLQCLEQLRFDTYGGGDFEKKSYAFELAPKLKRLELNLACSSVPRIPVSQIQSLTISYNCLPFAAKLPNLISLSCTTPASHSGPPVSLVSLPSLTIHPTVMRSVTTPSLTQLHLISKDGAVCSPPQFASFVTRNHFSLHALILENVLIHANDLLDILPLVPTLQVLTLVTLRPDALTDRLMRTLAISVGSFEPQLLPTLTKLSVVGGYLFSNTTLLDMLESRASESAGRVRHVRLHLTQRQFKDEELDRLRALGRRGVWFSVKCLDAEKQFVRVI